MEWRNAVHLPNGNYDCEVKHPVYGWVPCTASPSDRLTSELYTQIAQSGPIPRAPIEPDAPAILTPRQFAWLLAYTGNDEVWDEVANWTRKNDRATYADLEAERNSAAFQLPRVQYILSQPNMKAILRAIGKQVDISTITAHWATASQK